MRGYVLHFAAAIRIESIVVQAHGRGNFRAARAKRFSAPLFGIRCRFDQFSHVQGDVGGMIDRCRPEFFQRRFLLVGRGVFRNIVDRRFDDVRYRSFHYVRIDDFPAVQPIIGAANEFMVEIIRRNMRQRDPHTQTAVFFYIFVLFRYSAVFYVFYVYPDAAGGRVLDRRLAFYVDQYAEILNRADVFHASNFCGKAQTRAHGNGFIFVRIADGCALDFNNRSGRRCALFRGGAARFADRENPVAQKKSQKQRYDQLPSNFFNHCRPSVRPRQQIPVRSQTS